MISHYFPIRETSKSCHYQPSITDVLFEKGKQLSDHEGNVRFQNILKKHQHEYKTKSPSNLHKASISSKVIAEVRSFGGRFLERDAKYGMWLEMGSRRAGRKVRQALREDEETEEANRKVSLDPDHRTGRGKSDSKRKNRDNDSEEKNPKVVRRDADVKDREKGSSEKEMKESTSLCSSSDCKKDDLKRKYPTDENIKNQSAVDKLTPPLNDEDTINLSLVTSSEICDIHRAFKSSIPNDDWREFITPTDQPRKRKQQLRRFSSTNGLDHLMLQKCKVV